MKFIKAIQEKLKNTFSNFKESPPTKKVIIVLLFIFIALLVAIPTTLIALTASESDAPVVESSQEKTVKDDDSSTKKKDKDKEEKEEEAKETTDEENNLENNDEKDNNFGNYVSTNPTNGIKLNTGVNSNKTSSGTSGSSSQSTPPSQPEQPVTPEKNGWVEEEGNRYYYQNGKKVSGFQEIEGKVYYFDEVDNILETTSGLQTQNDDPDKMFYINEDGTVCEGFQDIDGETYYFGENYFAVNGFQEIDSNNYYFDNYELQKGLINVDDKLIYTNEAGELQYGWQTINNNKYYFNSDGYAVNGFQEIEGKTYFFSNINYVLKSGWQTWEGQTFYLNSDGTLYGESGWQTVEGKKYYFENNYVVKGAKEIDGETYYFDESTGEFKTGVYNINGADYYYNNYGQLTKVQYYPYYYSQRDSQWSNTYYGSGNMKNSGCAPTAMAMAFSGILGRTILPTDVAYYLYWNTSEFNKPTLGASGLAVQYASSHFGVPWEGLSSQSQVEQALSNGKIVFANVGPGKFTSPGLTHAIVLYKNDNGTTYAYDPYNSENNGAISISSVWQQQSTNSYDLRGGFAFYALG